MLQDLSNSYFIPGIDGDAGECIEDVAALWNAGRMTIYRALAG